MEEKHISSYFFMIVLDMPLLLSHLKRQLLHDLPLHSSDANADKLRVKDEDSKDFLLISSYRKNMVIESMSNFVTWFELMFKLSCKSDIEQRIMIVCSSSSICMPVHNNSFTNELNTSNDHEPVSCPSSWNCIIAARDISCSPKTYSYKSG